MKTFIIATIICLFAVVLFGQMLNATDTYTKEVKVVSTTNQQTRAIDRQGNYWTITNSTEYNKGDRLIITIDSNQTTTIYDDTVIEADRVQE